VLGGAGLLVGFPLAYSVILSALYLPIVFMLLGLVFRGVAFEFRFKAIEQQRHWWDCAFIGGSTVAAFSQGVILGAYIDGIPVVERTYAGGTLSWLTPFSLLTGIGLCVAYALLGSTWLILKTGGALRARVVAITRPLSWALLAVIIGVSLWTPLAHPAIARRWFSLPTFVWFCPVPILVALAFWKPAAILARRTPGGAVRAHLGSGFSRLHWLWHQCLAQRRATGDFSLGCGGPATESWLHARGCAARHPDDPRLHGLGLLRVPGQSGRLARLPLMAHSPTPTGDRSPARWSSRLAWLILIWAASVLTLAVAAYAFRLLMAWVGLTR
jgi:hypothetical protein